MKRAEIGRENRKMVERLDVIARGAETGYDPRAPPRRSSSSVPEWRKGKSLTESGQRQRQRVIDEKNAALVKRIMNVKGTFNRGAEIVDFQRHQHASWVLQRLPPEKLKQKSNSCPTLQHTDMLPQYGSSTGLTGLDMLIIPGELKRGLAFTAPR